MQTPVENRMLGHCLSIDAWDFAEQCPTYGTDVTYVHFWLLEHSVLRLERAQGGRAKSAIGDGNSAVAALGHQGHCDQLRVGAESA